VKNLVWGNDYPHHDSIWPKSMEVLARILDGVPHDEIDAVVFGRVSELYGIELPAELVA